MSARPPVHGEAPRAPAERLTHAANVIGVASGKGGVGKTWLSVSLSHALALRQRRVLLFDGDLGLANVNVQLGLMPKRDLGAVIAGTLALRAAATRCEAGFDIIAGRSGTATLSTLPVQRLDQLRRDLVQLASSYDDVILDLGAGVDGTVRSLGAAAATTLVVITDEPTSLTDAYGYIKLAHQSGLSAGVQVVVNMAASRLEGERSYRTLARTCDNFLQVNPPLAGIIRRDPRVRDAIRAQAPILARYPQTDAAQDLLALADRLRR